MAKNNNLTDFVTDLADAIRAKCKTTGKINPQDFSKFVGGMPFFKFRQTVDVTPVIGDIVTLPLEYTNEEPYIHGYVYLTNDNGLTIMPNNGTAMIIANGFTSDTLFSLNTTDARIMVSGYNSSLYANFISIFSDDAGTGESLITGGWHTKIDIYEMCIGNPDGENTKIDLDKATGRGA